MIIGLGRGWGDTTKVHLLKYVRVRGPHRQGHGWDVFIILITGIITCTFALDCCLVIVTHSNRRQEVSVNNFYDLFMYCTHCKERTVYVIQILDEFVYGPDYQILGSHLERKLVSKPAWGPRCRSKAAIRPCQRYCSSWCLTACPNRVG